MNRSQVLGKDWVSKNYSEEKVNFLKDNFNLSEIVSKLIAIRNNGLKSEAWYLKSELASNIGLNFKPSDLHSSIGTLGSVSFCIIFEWAPMRLNSPTSL